MLEPGPIDAQPHPAQIGVVPAVEADRRLVERIGVVRVRPGDDGIGQGRVAHRCRDGAEVAHRPRQGRGSVLADATEGGLEADQTGQRGRNADRAAAVGPDGDGAKARRHGRRRAVGAAAGVAVEVPGVADDAVMLVEPVGVDADLVHVGLADEQRAAGPQAGDDRRVLGGGRAAHEARADRRPVGNLIDLILHRYRHAIEQAQRPSGAMALGRGAGLGRQIVAVGVPEGAQGAGAFVAGGDGRQHGLGHGFGVGRALAVGAGIVGRRRHGFVAGRRPWLGFQRRRQCRHIDGGHILQRGRFFNGQRVERRRVVEAKVAQVEHAALLQQLAQHDTAQRAVVEGRREQAQGAAVELG